jgi:hypothetical protein
LNIVGAIPAMVVDAEIYEEAFGKPLSFKDPERAKLCERLDRWIEKDFSKTAKGKSALKQGAARR